jgi:hypothetical protein
MENFFNWMSKPVPHEEVIVWFNVHNMNYEKIEICGDIFKSLYLTMYDTYLGEDGVETGIEMSHEENVQHFEWCWKTIVENFRKENIIVSTEGKHKDYFKSFFLDTFYDPKEKNIKGAIPNFMDDVFNLDKPFTKSDLDILTELYTLVDKNIEY